MISHSNEVIIYIKWNSKYFLCIIKVVQSYSYSFLWIHYLLFNIVYSAKELGAIAVNWKPNFCSKMMLWKFRKYDDITCDKTRPRLMMI